MDKLTISVAMCTYNGEKFLQQQLDSIANQSRLPDELVLCDDKSLDQTMSIVERFSSSVTFPVRIFKNKDNLGSTKNFEKAVTLCKGDIIAFADQDDIWCADKLQLMEGVFNSSPKTGAVFSNGSVVSEELFPLGYTLWDTFRFDKKPFLNGNIFELLLNHNVVTGATMAFRSCFIQNILPISPLWVHDAWIVILLSKVSEIKFIDKELIKYRQHSNQQIGGVKKGLSEKIAISQSVKNYSSDIQELNHLIDHIQKNRSLADEHFISLITEKIDHLHKRQEIYSENTLAGVAKSFTELFCSRYHKYSSGYRSFIKDISICFGF